MPFIRKTFIDLLVSICILIPLFARASNPNNSPLDQYNSSILKLQQQYIESLAIHHYTLMRDLENKLQQQAWQTTVIAIVVILMVITGVALAALHFYMDYKNKGKSQIHIKFGTGVFEVNSSVIGVFIILASMWFFNLYIDKVYSPHTIPIAPIDFSGNNSSQSANTK